MSALSKETFWVHVVDSSGKGLGGVRVVLTYDVGEFDGAIEGLTNANGRYRIKCNYSFKAEVFLNNKSYGFYWCENGSSISIKI